MIILKINVTKINKDLLFKGQKGTYLDAVLHEKPNEYGDDGFITQSISKERRDAGEKGPIIGSYRDIQTGKKPAQAQAPKPAPTQQAEDEYIPF
jgi:hypothetical protein